MLVLLFVNHMLAVILWDTATFELPSRNVRTYNEQFSKTKVK
jgi:hypothetical protein